MKKTTKRVHLVNLFRWRSVAAFVACMLTIILTLGSVIYGIINSPPELVKTEFEWFTVDSNCLTAFAALMILPYTVEGVRKKRLVYPKWVLLVHYAGTICITLTLVFVLAFMSWFKPEKAFGNENIYLHVICPIAVLISFFLVESNYRLKRTDTLISMIPFAAYSILYLFNVAIFHNWEDHYYLNMFAPAYISMPIMYIMTYLIAAIIRYVHNRLIVYREKKLRAIWDEELDSVSVKIEVFSLGKHAGLYQEKEAISIPFDILEEISKKFDIKKEDIAKAYNKGVIEGMREREKANQRRV